jgi:aminoglycoside 6'-N-acetyltransferase I
MRITNFPIQNQEMIEQSANLLVEGFKEHWPRAWPDLDAALEEVRGSLGPGSTSSSPTTYPPSLSST